MISEDYNISNFALSIAELDRMDKILLANQEATECERLFHKIKNKGDSPLEVRLVCYARELKTMIWTLKYHCTPSFEETYNSHHMRKSPLIHPDSRCQEVRDSQHSLPE